MRTLLAWGVLCRGRHIPKDLSYPSWRFHRSSSSLRRFSLLSPPRARWEYSKSQNSPSLQHDVLESTPTNSLIKKLKIHLRILSLHSMRVLPSEHNSAQVYRYCLRPGEALTLHPSLALLLKPRSRPEPVESQSHPEPPPIVLASTRPSWVNKQHRLPHCYQGQLYPNSKEGSWASLGLRD